LLAASLGCVANAQGDPVHAEGLLAWIEASATDNGHLPEQVADDVQSPHMLRYWRQRWGQTATPLLWSHAMHLVLLDDLGRLSTHRRRRRATTSAFACREQCPVRVRAARVSLRRRTRSRVSAGQADSSTQHAMRRASRQGAGPPFVHRLLAVI
jgi:hypothetical protein